jgi:hypothetical protein
MSTVVAFPPARPRRVPRPVAEVVPIEAARSARARSCAGSGAAAHAAPGLATGPAPLRLTRRGRVVAAGAAALLLIVTIAAGVLLIGQQAVAGDQARPMPASYHIVVPGDTLWSIAGAVAPRSDRRDTVARIAEFNALGTVVLRPGQRIAIPGDLGGG